MTPLDWGVVAGGLALIVWINWYFFLSEPSGAVVAVGARGVAEVPIVVRGGYSPATVRVTRGVTVRLVFDRQEDASCSEEVVLPDFGIRRFLPAHAQTVVEITPTRAGTFPFTCGMSMLRGSLVVEDA